MGRDGLERCDASHPTGLIERVASDGLIDRAYGWLCKVRKDYHHNDDVWQVRRWEF